MPPSRKKSCQQCRASKTRCDLTVPQCGRCIEKRKICRYDIPRSSSRSQPMNSDGSMPRTTICDLALTFGRESRSGEARTSATSPPSWTESQLESQPWPIENQPLDPSLSSIPPDIPSFERTSSAEGRASGSETLPTSSAGIPSSNFSSDWGRSMLGFFSPTESGNDPVAPPEDQSLPRNEAETSKPHDSTAPNLPFGTIVEQLQTDQIGGSLTLRKCCSVESSLSAIMLFNQVKKYPSMMVKGPVLPPFIHPQCLVGGNSMINRIEDTRSQYPEPLANCASIVRMALDRSATNSSLIRRTILMEQRRLNDEFEGHDECYLLASFQALLIYLILEAMDPDTTQEACATTLRTAVRIARRVHELGYHGGFEVTEMRLSWIDWTYHESLRRAVNLLFVLEKLLNVVFGPAEVCSRGFNEIPLPSSGALWEADNGAVWEQEYRRQLERMEPDDLMIGAINKSKYNPNISSPEENGDRLQKLIAWCSKVDEFGILVWTAARLTAK